MANEEKYLLLALLFYYFFPIIFIEKKRLEKLFLNVKAEFKQESKAKKHTFKGVSAWRCYGLEREIQDILIHIPSHVLLVSFRFLMNFKFQNLEAEAEKE